MKINFSNCNLYKTFYDRIDKIDNVLPEIAFVGRSNVGKSSLLNLLVERKGLAKVSQTPGKTRSINYYNVDNKFYLVDLPGYGYSKLSKQLDLSLKQLIQKYFKENENLKAVCQLIDSRHKPTELDKEMNTLLNFYNYSYFIVLTKTDKIKYSEKKQSLIKTGSDLNLDPEVEIFFSSSEKKEGRKEIQDYIKNLLLK